MRFLLLLIVVVLQAGGVARSGTSEPAPVPEALRDPACVILLHGLARTSGSMDKMAEALESHGYQVANVDYPSRDKTIEELARSVVPKAVQECRATGAQRIEFVTHSMGGILVRYYLAQHSIPELGRVVMLSPPNQGSEVVDELAAYPGFEFVNGPAGYQLGTDETSVPLSLGPVDYEVGVITGDRSINWILSWLIPGEDDGKVSVERAKLEGMSDFLVVHHSHPLIMRAEAVVLQTIHFLQRGYFIHDHNSH